MGVLRDIINQEVTAIENNPACLNRTPKNIMIVIQFEGDHTHVQMPPIPVAIKMLEHIAECITKQRLIVIPDTGKLIVP